MLVLVHKVKKQKNLPQKQKGTHKMSEQAPKTEYSQTADTGEDVIDGIGKFKQVTYKNGVKHLYGVDAEGKNVHLSHEALLSAYGHSLKENKQNTDDYVHNSNNNAGAEDIADLLVIGNTIDYKGKQYEIVDFDNFDGEPVVLIHDTSNNNLIDIYHRVDDLVANGAKSVESVKPLDAKDYFMKRLEETAVLYHEGKLDKEQAALVIDAIKSNLKNDDISAIETSGLVDSLERYYEDFQQNKNARASASSGNVVVGADPDAQHNSEPSDANKYFNDRLFEIATRYHNGSLTIDEAVYFIKSHQAISNEDPLVANFDVDQVVDGPFLETVYQTNEAEIRAKQGQAIDPNIVNIPANPDAPANPDQGAPVDPNTLASPTGPDSAAATPDPDTINTTPNPKVSTFAKVHVALQNLLLSPNITPDQRTKRRKKILTAAMGVILVGATIAVLNKYGADMVDAVQDVFDNSPEPGNNPPNEFDFSKKALKITKGEGWYNTFKELDINPADYARLLEVSGPDLVDMGIAYEAPDLGGYGISHSGNMPIKALELLKENAAKL